jgi:hypothetical protein
MKSMVCDGSGTTAVQHRPWVVVVVESERVKSPVRNNDNGRDGAEITPARNGMCGGGGARAGTDGRRIG